MLKARRRIKLVEGSLLYGYKPGVTKGDDPKLRGEPDSSLFNRNEKHEIVYLIGKFVNNFKLSGNKVADIQKTERLIHKHLPGDVRSQDRVIEWLRLNFNSYT